MATGGRKKKTGKDATLSAVELARESGMPIRLIVAYTEQYGEEIPRVVDDDERVWYFPHAVVEVQRLRREERARKQITVEIPDEQDSYQMALAEILAIRDSLAELGRRASQAEKLLRAERPPVYAVIYTLPEGYRLRQPLTVLIQADGKGFVASLPDVPLESVGRTRDEAAHLLRTLIAATVDRLERQERLTDEERGQLDALLALVETP
jgi:predicted RNase H-like HicB family nuclease